MACRAIEGSILPGCAIDSGVYRPRRWSREQTCPVGHTDPHRWPWPVPAMPLSPPVWACSALHIGACLGRADLAVPEHQQVTVSNRVTVSVQCRRELVGRGFVHGLVDGDEVLLVGQSGDAGGDDDLGDGVRRGLLVVVGGR